MRMLARFTKVLLSLIACTIFGAISCTAALYGEETQPTPTATIASVAIDVFNQDHIDFDVKITEHYSPIELSIIAEHRSETLALVHAALNRGNSIWGAKIAGHLQDTGSLEYLRHRIYLPQHCYGWEGPDYNKVKSYLTDNQYQYSTTYIDSLKKIKPGKLRETIPPTQSEQEIIAQHAANKESSYHHWALWISLKLDE